MSVMAGHGRLLAVVTMAILLLSGCEATRARRGTPEMSGFLGDYSGLQKNPASPAALVYVKPDVSWSRYDAIQLESAGQPDRTSRWPPRRERAPSACARRSPRPRG